MCPPGESIRQKEMRREREQKFAASAAGKAKKIKLDRQSAAFSTARA
jgi:hypothetical protein